MKIYCFYGVGVSTERSYYYAVTDENVEEKCSGGAGCTHEHSHEHQDVDTSNTSRSLVNL